MTKTKDLRPKTQSVEPSNDEVAAIILAAGRSSRMGAFKPLLPFGDLSVIQSCVRFLLDGGVAAIIVVISPDERSKKLRDHLRAFPVTFAVNPDPASEMSASIASGIQQVPEGAKAVVITPVDYPAVPAVVVQQIISEWRLGASLVIPTWAGRGGHPVLVDLSLRQDLVELDPARGLKGLFDSKQRVVRRVPVNSNYIARDIDTWDDYAVLHQEVFGGPPPKGFLRKEL